ncbi:hypothetical protein U0070_004009 [Myodes glareolus]|uniref:Uncharacterized protein n=1 Tax=Myodes glareolus TaxID=447135 RepID=A0AAW0KB06_MYOGA
MLVMVPILPCQGRDPWCTSQPDKSQEPEEPDHFLEAQDLPSSSYRLDFYSSVLGWKCVRLFG